MNITIKARLIAAFLLLILLSGSIYFIADRSLSELNKSLNRIVRSETQQVNLTGQISTGIQYIGVRLRDIVISDTPEFTAETIRLREDRLQKVNQAIEELLSLQDEEKRAVTNELIEIKEQYDRMSTRIVQTKLSGAEDAKERVMKILAEEGRPIVVNINKALDKLTAKSKKDLDIADKEAAALYDETRSTMIMLVVTGIMFSIIVGIWIIYSIATSINTAKDAIKAISEGDLTIEIAGSNKDEMGELLQHLNNMVIRLKDIISSVTSAAENIASASEQMSGSTQQLSEGSTEQAASAEEVSSSMEEMAANIQQNTDNSQQTEKIALKVAEDVQEGSRAVNQTVDSMKKISEKISIIGEIARQTNLLALNAAVEAARAGEHGKGFAVVAAEVRRLAERSQLAANEINDLSSSSVAIAEKSGKLLELIVPDIQKTARLVQEITASSLEQNSGAEQVNGAIQQLNQVIQQNAAGAEEMASGSEELSSQADQLKDTVSFFKVGNQRKISTVKVKNITKRNKQYLAGAHQEGNHFVKKGGTAKTGLQLNLNGDDSLDSGFIKF